MGDFNETAQGSASTVRRALLNMHEDTEGRSILNGGHIMRFIAARDNDYDPIRSHGRCCRNCFPVARLKSRLWQTTVNRLLEEEGRHEEFGGTESPGVQFARQ